LKDKSRENYYPKIYWWGKENLFATRLQGLLSLLALYVIGWLVWKFLMWGVWNATFFGEDINSCERPGACWAMVTARWEQFVYGFYPVESRWRVNLSFALFFATFLIIAFSVLRSKLKIIVLIMSLLAIFTLLIGGYWGLTVVNTEEWGGLFLTLVLAFSGIIAAFPIALLLALGRQSKLKIIKTLCIVFIETVRGVPLI
jgi:general L-amino acid transport system permease protein